MKFHEKLLKACWSRDIPDRDLLKLTERIDGTTGEERERIQNEIAELINQTYPYLPGRDPGTLEKADGIISELKRQGITWQNFLEDLDSRSDEEITCMLNAVHNGNCRWWVYDDRKKRPEVHDRQRAEEIRDGVVRFSWRGWKKEDVPSRFWTEDEKESE